MSELQRAVDEFVISLKVAVRAYTNFVREAIKAIAETAERIAPVVEAQILYNKIQMAATPNERRMMHNKRKRIRKKYYNRVKRRIWG